MSVPSLYLLNKAFTVIWYLKTFLSSNKSSNRSSILDLLAVNWTDEFFESII